jgi:iron complex transport system ATP-binding protein
MSAYLETRELDFGYSAEKPVIRNASLSLVRGTLAAIIGANGCGKSTLIRLLAGILKPDRGSVHLEGSPLHSMSLRKVARKIAYVPQSTSDTFPFTALEVVLTGRAPSLKRFRFESPGDLAKARAALDTVGIPHLEDRPMTRLSGGERQLVSLARALVQGPECLLLDEPSASLDLKHRAEIMRLLITQREQSGMTCLIATHDLEIIDPGVDVIFAMRDGCILAAGPPAEVMDVDVLREVYDDSDIRVGRLQGRTFVWSEK